MTPAQKIAYVTATANAWGARHVATAAGGPNPDAVLNSRLDVWINGIYGILLGYQRELEEHDKARTKLRPVTLQWYADVGVGANNDYHAKAIQAKAVGTSNVFSVDEAIKEGIRQLMGLFEAPRPNDVRVVDVTITDDLNSWPRTGGARDTNITRATLVQEVKDLVEHWIKWNEPMMKWLKGSPAVKATDAITRLNAVPGIPAHPNSTRTVLTRPNGAGVDVILIRNLTVKINFNPAYHCALGGPDVTKIVVQACRTGGPGNSAVSFIVVKTT